MGIERKLTIEQMQKSLLGLEKARGVITATREALFRGEYHKCPRLDPTLPQSREDLSQIVFRIGDTVEKIDQVMSEKTPHLISRIQARQGEIKVAKQEDTSRRLDAYMENRRLDPLFVRQIKIRLGLGGRVKDVDEEEVSLTLPSTTIVTRPAAEESKIAGETKKRIQVQLPDGQIFKTNGRIEASYLEMLLKAENLSVITPDLTITLYQVDDEAHRKSLSSLKEAVNKKLKALGWEVIQTPSHAERRKGKIGRHQLIQKKSDEKSQSLPGKITKSIGMTKEERDKRVKELIQQGIKSDDEIARVLGINYAAVVSSKRRLFNRGEVERRWAPDMKDPISYGRQALRLRSQGQSLAEVIRILGITQGQYYRAVRLAKGASLEPASLPKSEEEQELLPLLQISPDFGTVIYEGKTIQIEDSALHAVFKLLAEHPNIPVSSVEVIDVAKGAGCEAKHAAVSTIRSLRELLELDSKNSNLILSGGIGYCLKAQVELQTEEIQPESFEDGDPVFSSGGAAQGKDINLLRIEIPYQPGKDDLMTDVQKQALGFIARELDSYDRVWHDRIANALRIKDMQALMGLLQNGYHIMARQASLPLLRAVWGEEDEALWKLLTHLKDSMGAKTDGQFLGKLRKKIKSAEREWREMQKDMYR